MARQRMVTRTVESTTGIVMWVDIETGSTFTNSETVTGKLNKEEFLKTCQKMDTTNIKHVAVMGDVVVVEKLYGMSEATFMSMAVELDPETRKPLETL